MSNPPVVTQLEASHAKPLRFTISGQQLVPNDFHVTEVKKVSVESLDCGGGASAWQELVIQLWSPRGDNTPEAMTAEKFSQILTKAGALHLLGGERVRFEYGSSGMPAVQYELGSLSEVGNTLDIDLIPPHVACKPAERHQLDGLSVVQDAGCCAPSASPAKACCG